MRAARLGWRTYRVSCVAYVTVCTASWLYCYGLPYLKVRSELKVA